MTCHFTNHLRMPVLIAVVFLLLEDSANGQNPYNGLVWSLTGSAISITGYDGSGGGVTIPNSIPVQTGTDLNGFPTYTYFPVTSIAAYAFVPYYNPKANLITSITIPSGVTSIGTGAFAGCQALTSVTIPSGVTTIPDSAFADCASLTSITIPNSVTSIAEYAFYECYDLTSVSIPNSVTSIGNSAFLACTNLANATLGTGITIIPYRAFAGCDSLTSLTIPNSVTEIGVSAFSGAGLINLTVPSSVTRIDDTAFFYCPALNSITIGNGVQSIGTNVFYHCISLTSVSLPNSLVTLGAGAFEYCSALANASIDNNLTGIPDYSFAFCSRLANISTGSNIKSIGLSAFYYCTNLSNITIPNSMTTISDGAFAGCASLTSIVIPNNVTAIGETATIYSASGAFSECASLRSVTLPSGLTSIGNDTFAYSGLASIAIPSSVTNVGYNAFAHCGNLTNLTITSGTGKGSTVTSIGIYAFLLCTNLVNIDFQNNAVSIAEVAFQQCYGLTSIRFGSGVTSIEWDAFTDCPNLSYICFEGNAPVDGGYIFGGDANVHTIYYAAGTSGWGSIFSEINTAPCEQCSTSTIVGQVSSSRDGSPISSAFVLFGNESSVGFSATSDGTGQYAISGLSPGTYAVAVSAVGYSTLHSSMTVPPSAHITQNFSLTPTNKMPVVTSITTSYSPDGEILYFLDGVSFFVAFSASVNWGGHPAGTVQFITPNQGDFQVDASGGDSVSQTIDVGSAFGVGGHLQVRAVSSDGTASIASVANFMIMSAPFPIPFQLSYRGDGFGYESTIGANLQFFNDFLPPGVSVNSNIPLFGDNPMGLKYAPSVDVDIDENNASFKVNVSSDEGDGDSGGEGNTDPILGLAGLTFDLAPEASINAIYGQSTGQWNWGGTLGISADINYSFPPINLPIPIPVPIYAKVGFDLSANAGLNVVNLNPVSLNGAVEFNPTINGSLGAGVDNLLAVEGWVKGEVDLTFQYPPQLRQTALQNYKIQISAGVTVYALLYTYKNQLFSWDWPNQSPSGEVQSSLAFNESSSPRPYPRNYLKTFSYAAFKGGPSTGFSSAIKSPGMQSGISNPLLYPLQTDIFPFSEPSISSNGTNCYAVWLCDNPNRIANNQTMLVFSEFNGSSWSTDSPVADDGTADFHPQLRAFADGAAAVAWENEAKVISTNADFTAMVTNLEIETAFYNPVVSTWQRIQKLTTNNYLDRTPRIAGPAETNLMLVWVANTNNDLEGNNTNTNELLFSTWNGTTWSTPQIFAYVPFPLLKCDMTYDGTNAYVVMSLDSDNTLTNVNAHALFEVAYRNHNWGGLTQLTTNAVPNDNPQLALDPYGNIILTWLQNNSICSVVNFNFANEQIVGTDKYSSNLGDFKLAKTSDGRLAIVWAAPSPQNSSDLWVMFYDPDFEVWGGPHQVTDDPETEMETAATFYGTNQLLALYDRLGIAIGDTNQTGSSITNADLYVLQYQLTNDLVLVTNSLTASPANPTPGNTVVLSVVAENLGDFAVSNVLVAFYQGNPANGGTEIGQTNIAALMPPGASNVISILWTVPATTNSLTIYAAIDPEQQYPESSPQNEVISSAFVKQDLVVQSIIWGPIASNLISIAATVINEGTIASRPATVSFFLNSLAGTNLFSTNIVSLAPGQSIDVNFIWNAPNLGNGLNLFAVVDSGTNVLNFNFQRNSLELTIQPNITLVNVLLGPVTLLPGRIIRVDISGLAGQTYLIEASTDLVHWTSLTNLTLTNGIGQFTDPTTASYPQRFYRAIVFSQAQPELGEPQLISGGVILINVKGSPGQSYTIEASTNLVNWVTLTNIFLPSSIWQFVDQSKNFKERFYRAGMQ